LLEAERAAVEADNAAKLEAVRRRYRSEQEAGRENNLAQIAILDELTGLTANQEIQRAETIRRIRDEMAVAEADAQIARNEFLAGLEVEAAATALEREQLRHQQRLERVLAEAEELGIAREEIHALVEGLEEKHQRRMHEITVQAEKQRQREQTAEQKKGVDAGLSELARLTSGTAQHSKTMFKINKIAAIADATVNTAKGVTKTLSEYPWPLAGILAAAHAAAGVAQVAAIQSTSYEGGGSGTTPSLAGSTSVYNSQAVDSQITTDGRSRADERSQVQIIVTGNIGFTPEVIDQIADGLQEATGERDVMIFGADSRQAQELVEVTNVGN
jgi:hypothetical protein